MILRKPRQYFGVNISPSDDRANRTGFRWQAYVNGSFRYADTLQGIKSLVRAALSK